jgi:hypothetical protein
MMWAPTSGRRDRGRGGRLGALVDSAGDFAAGLGAEQLDDVGIELSACPTVW